MIQIGKRGRIRQGSYAGWYVLIEDDTANTGGYYVYTSRDSDFKGEGYDDWVENKELLEPFFTESEWEVDWDD